MPKKPQGGKVILFKRRNWQWNRVAYKLFSLATSPVFLNPGQWEQWETTLVLAAKFLGQLHHKSSFSSCFLHWVRPFFNVLFTFEIPTTASARDCTRNKSTHTHTHKCIHAHPTISQLDIGPKSFCTNCLDF